MTATALTPVDDPADPRLADFVGLSDPELRQRAEVGGGFFIAEGALAVEQLLLSSYTVRAVLVSEVKLDRLRAQLDGLDAPIYVAPRAVIDATIGFTLHRGIVASANRAPLPDPLDIASKTDRIAVLESVNDHENLGALFRNARAFGIGAVLLDPTTADPLYRRAVRVSLGHVLHVPFARTAPLPGALDNLRAMGFTVIALTPALDAEPLATLAADPPARVAFLLGAEGPGLSDGSLAAADRRVRIPMAPGVDSVNVATAAALAFQAQANAHIR